MESLSFLADEAGNTEIHITIEEMKGHLEKIQWHMIQNDVPSVDNGMCKLSEYTHDLQEKWRRWVIEESYRKEGENGLSLINPRRA